MRLMGSTAQTGSPGWQALTQRKLTELSCLCIRGKDRRDFEKEGGRRGSATEVWEKQTTVKSVYVKIRKTRCHYHYPEAFRYLCNNLNLAFWKMRWWYNPKSFAFSISSTFTEPLEEVEQESCLAAFIQLTNKARGRFWYHLQGDLLITAQYQHEKHHPSRELHH